MNSEFADCFAGWCSVYSNLTKPLFYSQQPIYRALPHRGKVFVHDISMSMKIPWGFYLHLTLNSGEGCTAGKSVETVNLLLTVPSAKQGWIQCSHFGEWGHTKNLWGGHCAQVRNIFGGLMIIVIDFIPINGGQALETDTPSFLTK